MVVSLTCQIPKNTLTLSVGGTLRMTDGTGSGVCARVSAVSPDTIYVTFPNLSSGGYLVNALQVIVDGNSGFLAGGLPAVLGTNPFITYGVSATTLDTPVFTPQAESLQRIANWSLSQSAFGRESGGRGAAREKLASCRPANDAPTVACAFRPAAAHASRSSAGCRAGGVSEGVASVRSASSILPARSSSG